MFQVQFVCYFGIMCVHYFKTTGGTVYVVLYDYFVYLQILKRIRHINKDRKSYRSLNT